MITRNIYWRQSRRHHWVCIAQCHENLTEFIRQIYMAQVDMPGWQIGWTTEKHVGLYPDNKKADYPMTVAPDITDNTTIGALNRFIRTGFTSINPPIMGAMVELELL